MEVWQFPEKSVGINAEQAVCVVIGILGQSQKVFPVASKAVFSRVKEEVKSIRENGFLGSSWLNKLNSKELAARTQFWHFSVAPPIPIKVPTILLGNLFYVFGGVTPKKINEQYHSNREPQQEIPYKRNWSSKWRNPSRIWADPECVPSDEQWIRYHEDYLKCQALENKALFDNEKVLIAKTINRGSNYPLAAQFDSTGFCPNKHIFCVLPANNVNKYSKGYQAPDLLPDK